MAETTYDALRDAIWNDDVEMLKHHMRTGRIDANHTDAAGQTLLHLAAFWGRTEIVRILISLGGNMKTKNATGCTALDLAIHWGHSATAEIIRLRGGTSVWEEKMGLLQMQVEDLTTTLADVERQNKEQDAQLGQHRAEILALHTRWIESVDLYNAEAAKCTQLESLAKELEKSVANLHGEIERIKQELYESQMECFRLGRARESAEHERDAAIAHRNEAIAAQKAALDSCDERTKDWQAAERAAIIMETQRNMAFNERDDIKRRANLTIVELNLLTERLQHSQEELKNIKEEAAEFLHAKHLEDIRIKRANRAMEEFTAEKKAAAIQAAKELNERQQARRKSISKAPNHVERREQRAQTAAAIITQRTQQELHLFEQEFVHTVRSFTADRQSKWTEVQVRNQRSRQDAVRASLRPIYDQHEPPTPTSPVVTCEVYSKFGALRRQRPNTDHTPQRRKSQVQLAHLREATIPG